MEVFTMNEENFNQNTQQENEAVNESSYYTSDPTQPQGPFMMQESENVLMGVIGALLFSLVGGVLYFIVYQLGFIAGIAGFVSVICAVKGYKLLGKKETLKGVIISVLVSIAVIVIAAFYSIGFSVLDILKEFYPSASISFLNSPLYVIRAMQDSEDIMLAVASELGMALLLCIVGAGSTVVNAIKSAKASNQASNK